ncbi:MAG: Ni/Fe-hydrogenase cytochrome b subunit [Alphaproteobacteria bacterium]|nr:Ni/Fe-hydrogenase cytochrome b subunit [Alphaproteobacteria bacterium]
MKAQPIGGRLVSPVTLVLMVLILLAAFFGAQRFLFGFNSVANINDGFPWGIWIAWDVVIGTGLACGGFALALLVYIANQNQYHPLMRPALLASVFGYTLGGVSVIFDLGRYWNFWHILFPTYQQYGSVMVEVALCVAAYIIVLWIEFSPVLAEKFGWTGVKKFTGKWMFLFIALGVLLPTMHQSSLGSLLIVYGQQIHPLWQTMLLPLLFLLSAVAMGYAVVVFEACVSTAGFKRKIDHELPLIASLSKIMAWLLVAFIVIRLGDIVARGAFGAMFTSGVKSFMFWVEMTLYALPVAMLLSPSVKRDARIYFLAACSMLLAAVLYRIDAYLVGYETGPGWNYFPAVPEIMITIGIVAFEILGYIVFVRFFPVLPGHGPDKAH